MTLIIGSQGSSEKPEESNLGYVFANIGLDV